jgi:hypothetical protein
MRFVLCVVIAALLPVSALAAKGSGGSMSLSRAQAAAAKGDQNAARAVATTTDRESCMSGCANRGISKNKCVRACRPGLCHPGGEQPYCVSK